MATVISLTEAKIQELMEGWVLVGLSQDQINALVLQLRGEVESQGAALNEYNNVVRPQLEAELAANSILVSELNDTTLPALQATLDEANADLEDLNTVIIPALQQEVASANTNVNERPKSYEQAEPPTNPDDDGRDLVPGDSWFDIDDGSKQYVWNGVEWSTFGVDIPDFSLTAQKFKTSTHILY